MARDHSPLAQAAAQVPDADIERHRWVTVALQELAGAERTHARHMEEIRKQAAVLHEIDNRLLAATNRLGRLRDQLPGLAEAILLGNKLALQTKAQVLADMSVENGTIENTMLGRPAIDARLRALRGMVPGAAVTEAEERLERARHQARLELAEQRLARAE